MGCVSCSLSSVKMVIAHVAEAPGGRVQGLERGLGLGLTLINVNVLKGLDKGLLQLLLPIVVTVAVRGNGLRLRICYIGSIGIRNHKKVMCGCSGIVVGFLQPRTFSDSIRVT